MPLLREPVLERRAGFVPSSGMNDTAPTAHAATTAPAPIVGTPDADGLVWQAGAFRTDTWTHAGDDAALSDLPSTVSRKRWLAERATLIGRNAPLGLRLTGGESLDDIAADLVRFGVIVLTFPKFSDGRAYSTARLLREQYGYSGELRAAGDVLADQIPLMRRIGIDTFAVTNAPARRALADGTLAGVTLHYQPAVASEPPAGTRPWLRRTER